MSIFFPPPGASKVTLEKGCEHTCIWVSKWKLHALNMAHWVDGIQSNLSKGKLVAWKNWWLTRGQMWFDRQKEICYHGKVVTYRGDRLQQVVASKRWGFKKCSLTRGGRSGRFNCIQFELNALPYVSDGNKMSNFNLKTLKELKLCFHCKVISPKSICKFTTFH